MEQSNRSSTELRLTVLVFGIEHLCYKTSTEIRYRIIFEDNIELSV
jgi:hypothetical protein